MLDVSDRSTLLRNLLDRAGKHVRYFQCGLVYRETARGRSKARPAGQSKCN